MMSSKIKIMLAIATLTYAGFVPSASQIHASAKAPQSPSQFEGSAGWSKIDMRLREAWRDAISKGNEKTRLECLIKTKTPISEAEKAILKTAGFDYRAVIGTIVTGSLEAGALPRVSGLEFIEAMELAVPLSPKEKT